MRLNGRNLHRHVLPEFVHIRLNGAPKDVALQEIQSYPFSLWVEGFDLIA